MQTISKFFSFFPVGNGNGVDRLRDVTDLVDPAMETEAGMETVPSGTMVYAVSAAVWLLPSYSVTKGWPWPVFGIVVRFISIS